MAGSFRFRYTNELVGAFVLLAVILCVMGILLAGRSQGWFERKFGVRVAFNTEEGTFGLKEGSDVIIRSTVAGRVGRISPTGSGDMETTLSIQTRFRPFVRSDSVAKVKRKFVAAGDAFVEIAPGKGPVIEDNAFIICKRDEEVLETAQKMLGEVRSVMLPMLEEVQGILKHVNGILGTIHEGKGVASALLNDPELAGTLKATLTKVDALALASKNLVGDLGSVMSGEGVVGAIASDEALADEVKRAAVQMNVLMSEAQDTLVEARRLLQGAQKHWLFRKHVEQTDGAKLLSSAEGPDKVSTKAVDRLHANLVAARVADDSDAVARHAYNLAVLALADGRGERAERFLREASVAWRGKEEQQISIVLLKAEIQRASGDRAGAGALAEEARRMVEAASPDRDVKLAVSLLLADLHCDQGEEEAARKIMGKAKWSLRRTDSEVLKARGESVWGRILLLAEEYGGAGARFDEAAEAYRQLDLYAAMATALAQAASAYQQGEQQDKALNRYFRAARSSFYAGDLKAARRSVIQGVPLCDTASDKHLAEEMRALSLSVTSLWEKRDGTRAPGK